MEASPDVIVAVATAPVPSGIGVLRLSGKGLDTLCQALSHRPLPPPRTTVVRSFYDQSGGLIDQGILIYFAAPASFTGEEVLELQTHGSPVVLHELQVHAQACGARLAEPGEFTLRAFLNSRLDLTQAEAVSDLIQAESRQAARSAARALKGEFTDAIHRMIDQLVDQRVFLESHFDFSDEDVPVYQHQGFIGALQSMVHQLEGMLRGVQRGLLLRRGKRVVLIGVPNVGKSSLLNRLTEEDHALVTPVPGTTRDIIRGYWVLDGIPLHLIDTAGIRATDDLVEQAGIQRTWAEAVQADIAMVVADIRQGMTQADREILEKLPDSINKILILNKLDLLPDDDSAEIAVRSVHPPGLQYFSVSAHTGVGIPLLKQGIMALLQLPEVDDVFMVSERHMALLHRAKESLGSALNQKGSEELLAEDLQAAHMALQKIVGREYASDDLLGDIFSRFCIGK